MHFVFPGSVPAGFVIEEVEVVGMTALTGVEVVEVEHMVAGLVGVKRRVNGVDREVIYEEV